MRFFTLILLTFFSAFSNASEIEDQIFDRYRTDPQALLEKYYSRSQILFLGLAYHVNYQHIDRLRDLLKMIGQDENLKYIVLERAGDLKVFYEILSVKDLKASLKDFSFKDRETLRYNICHHEWAYTIDKLLPDVRAVNQRRVSPLLVTAVDGMRSYWKESYPETVKTAVDGDCRVEELPPKWDMLYVTSTNHEIASAENFYNKIYKNLGPKDKVIVLYNRGHLLTSFKACLPYMVNTELFEARKNFAFWIDFLYELAPEAKKVSNLVLFDEKYHPIKDGTTFKFSQRQSSRFPDQDWAIELDPFKDILNEVGLDMMSPTSDFQQRFTNKVKSSSLPEIAQGLIWNSKAHLLYSNRGRTGYDFTSTKPYCENFRY